MIDNCPQSLLEAARYFADLDVCNEYMKRIKWNGGVITCPHCGAKGERIGEITTRRMLRCKDCRKQFSHKVGTIFEDSPLGLDKWFVAVWAIANCKNGISSHELARAIGVTQKTAWFMLHRIRKAMELLPPDDDKFVGPAEADATYLGGAAANMHKKVRKKKITGRGGVDKTIVHGVLQRANGEGEVSQVRAAVVGDDAGARLLPEVRRHVRYGAEVFTDEARAYAELCFTHLHKSVDHSVAYVVENVHTNGIELLGAAEARVARHVCRRRSLPPVSIRRGASFSIQRACDRRRRAILPRAQYGRGETSHLPHPDRPGRCGLHGDHLMKSQQEIDVARQKLCQRLQTPGLNDVQKALVGGMLNALVWAAGGPNVGTMERMLANEPLAAGKDPGAALERFEKFVATESSYKCPKCGGPMAHSRLRGLFCMTCLHEDYVNGR